MDNVHLKYCLYTRKSSESDERQALSIEQQLREMRSLAQQRGFEIADTRQESHSAKASGHRPVFNQMIRDIQAGMFDAILTWAPDRLSRNAGDLGILVDLMDQGKLIEIHTHSQVFTNSPNDKFLLMILGSQAKLENDNRGVNVRRGMRNKALNGWRAGLAPVGYLNTPFETKKISLDLDRAPIVKEIFERVGYRHHTGRNIYLWLRSINFTTRHGNELVLSAIYTLLRNPFMYG